MEKIFRILLFIICILCMTSNVSAAAEKNEVTGLNDNVATSIIALGMQYEQDVAPFHRLQNMMRFEFIDGKEIHERFEITYDKNDPYGYGPSKHTVDFFLTYNRDAVKRKEQHFITGTFEYYHKFGDTVKEYKGYVYGMPVDHVEYDDISYDRSKEAIMLRLDVQNASWEWDIYLYVDTYMGNMKNPVSLPLSSNQMDIAAGIAVSIIGTALLNFVARASLTGSVSLNMVSAPLPDSVLKKTSGKPTGALSRFLPRIRDMLVDEGRSYLSGKIRDKLDDG